MFHTSVSDEARRKLLAIYPELAWFTYDHLPQHLAQVSALFTDLAWMVAHTLPHRPSEREQVRRCLVRLEEAKDCAVRAKVGWPGIRPATHKGGEVRGD